MSNYLEKKYRQYSKMAKCFLRSMAEAELLISESEVMELQRELFDKPIAKMTYFQFALVIELGLSKEVEDDFEEVVEVAPIIVPKLIKLSLPCSRLIAC